MYYKKNKLLTSIQTLLFNVRLNTVNSLSYLFELIYKAFSVDRITESNAILIVNTGDLGDIVITIPFLNDLIRSNNYDQHYILVKNSYVDLFNTLNIKINIIPWQKNKYRWNILFRISFLNSLRKKSFLTTINITPERGILNDELTLLCHSHNKIAVTRKAPYLKKYFNKINNEKYHQIIETNTSNEYEKLKKLSEYLNLKSFLLNDLFIPTSDKTLLPYKYIAVSPTPSRILKGWSISKYKRLINLLQKRYNIVLLGTKKNFRNFERIKNHNPNIYNYAGLTKLSELHFIIKNCIIFVGNDSGLTHFANILDVPFVAIIGGGSFGRFFPSSENNMQRYKYYMMDCFTCMWKCIYRERYCLTKVSVEEIEREVNSILDNLQ